MECHSAIKRNKSLLHAAAWMNLKDMLSTASQRGETTHSMSLCRSSNTDGTNLRFKMSECWLPLAEEAIHWEGTWEAFWGDTLFKSFDPGSAFTGVPVCKNSSLCTLKICTLYHR